MAQHFKGVAFGPGFAEAGAAVSFEAGENGLRLATHEADDGAPRWAAVTLAKSGWDGTQLRLEWQGAAGR